MKKENSILKFSKENIYQCVIAFLLFIIGFVYAYESRDIATEHQSEINMEEAQYLRFVHIGSSNCGFSNNEITHKMVKELKDYFRSFAHEQGYRFFSTGISVDKFSTQGIDFLNHSGSYDEIITGASWLNLGAKQYIWGEFPEYPDTPQILVTLSHYKVTSAGMQLGNIERKENLLDRVIGKDQIEQLLTLTKNSSSEEIASFLDLPNPKNND